MHIGRYGLIGCVAVTLQAGCVLRQAQDDIQPPIGAPGAMPQSRAITQHAERGGSWMPAEAKGGRHFAYVVNVLSTSVSAYSISASSGALTQVKGSPFKAGRGPLLMAIDPAGFAYATNQAINADNGALKKVNGSPFKAGVSSFGVAIW
jgi:hypothetical protein